MGTRLGTSGYLLLVIVGFLLLVIVWLLFVYDILVNSWVIFICCYVIVGYNWSFEIL